MGSQGGLVIAIACTESFYGSVCHKPNPILQPHSFLVSLTGATKELWATVSPPWCITTMPPRRRCRHPRAPTRQPPPSSKACSNAHRKRVAWGRDTGRLDPEGSSCAHTEPRAIVGVTGALYPVCLPLDFCTENLFLFIKCKGHLHRCQAMGLWGTGSSGSRQGGGEESTLHCGSWASSRLRTMGWVGDPAWSCGQLGSSLSRQQYCEGSSP